MTNGIICQKLCVLVQAKTVNLLLPSPVVFTQQPVVILRGHISSSLPASHLLSQSAPTQLQEEDSEKDPVRTSDPGASQLAIQMRKTVLDPHPQPPPDCHRDLNVEACETGPVHLSPRLSIHYV